MEQTDAGKCHGDAVFVADFDDIVVPNGAARLGDILDAAAVGALDVVAEGEECVGTQGHTLHGVKPGPLFLPGQGLRLYSEEILPNAVGQNVHIVVGNIHVDGVVPIGPADALFEGKVHGFGMLS